ncbi:MAG: DNA polymerase III subunit epsilon [Proteobacteria bacterium]|nr:DNA polymerase III subunit epsilon [Pseudomonadota bacterium]
MREIIFDTETTGFEPSEGHRMVEIGAMETIDRIPTGKTFHVYINPERDIPKETTRIHGISNEMVADKPIFPEVIDEMLEFFGDSPLVAHNAKFDMNFLNFQLEQEGIAKLPNPVVDTLKIAKRKFPGQRVSLDALCKKFDIDLSVRKYHGALLDARLLAEVYLELTGGRQRSLSLDVADSKNEKSARPTSTIEIKNRKAIEPSAEELENHNDFMGKISDNLW